MRQMIITLIDGRQFKFDYKTFEVCVTGEKYLVQNEHELYVFPMHSILYVREEECER